jgi:hypothetical protein
MRYLILTTFGLLPLLMFAQGSFYTQYSGSEYDMGHGVVQLPDSSYVLTGRSGSWGDNAEAYLLKISKTGAYQWSQHYGSYEFDEGRRVMSHAVNGLYVAGSSMLNQATAYDLYLLNTDPNGTLIWEKRVDLGGWEFTNDAILTFDDGVVMVGSSQDPNSSNSRGFIVKTNAAGDTLWSRFIGGTETNAVHTVLELHDSIYVVAGTYYNTDSTLNKGFIAAYHENGTSLWFTSIGDYGAFGITDITINLNRINAIGWRWNPILNKHDNYTGRYEFNGALFYESVFVNQVDVIFDEVTLNGNSNKLYVGYRNQNVNDVSFGMDVALGRFNTNFDWDNGPIYINHAGDEKVEQFIPTLDGGALAVGSITYPMNGGSSVFAMKIGPNDEFQTVIGNEPMLPLVATEPIDGLSVSLFPNPTQDFLSITLSQGVGLVSCLDSKGLVVICQEMEAGKTVLNVSALTAGVYFIQYAGTTWKFIKM